MDAMVRGRVWLDVTTTMRAGGNFDGTTRVERLLRLTHDLQARTAMERRILAERCLSSWLDCAGSIAAAADGLMERAA